MDRTPFSSASGCKQTHREIGYAKLKIGGGKISSGTIDDSKHPRPLIHNVSAIVLEEGNERVDARRH